jgi:hypothetical protein
MNYDTIDFDVIKNLLIENEDLDDEIEKKSKKSKKVKKEKKNKNDKIDKLKSYN